jgi:hypothetical protein
LPSSVGRVLLGEFPLNIQRLLIDLKRFIELALYFQNTANVVIAER